MFNCSKFHRATCEASSHTSVNLRVLNCLSRQVVKAPSNCRYIALSYVWSQSPPGQSEADNSVDTAALQNVPKVIEDSIELALRLGYLYLWVDRYCIDQTNAEAKHDQIRQMDLVYAEARLTIIAAADGDALMIRSHQGLPGLRNSFREAQPALRVGDWTLLSTMAHPRDAVEKSKWITRGWTYQEGLLSRRRLLYTNDQVTYECNADSCSE
ncbi:HET-domain-containing protein, partial [Polyplosphaeria fusca]